MFDFSAGLDRGKREMDAFPWLKHLLMDAALIPLTLFCWAAYSFLSDPVHAVLTVLTMIVVAARAINGIEEWRFRRARRRRWERDHE